MEQKERNIFESRLGKWPDERLETILAKRVARQLNYFSAQIEMDMAHTVMLAEQGVLTASETAQILGVLSDLREGGADGLPIRSARSSLFWYVEAALIDRLGEQVGGKMHTGRSHNDIMPTVSRLTARGRLLELIEVLVEFQAVLLRLAEPHVLTVMPGYTALQHSQPWTFGHYLVGWFYGFERDYVRLRNAYANTNQSSLGIAALAGTSWPLDRRRVAVLLGFDDILVNSRDAGFGTRDYVAEIIAAIGIAMTNLSTLCSDLYLWSTYEFGMIETADGFSGSSSFMPQKKNAWAVDWARGAAGNVVGSFASSLSAMRGTSSTDGSLQDYPEAPLREALEVATDYLRLVSGAVDTLQVNTERMLERAGANWSTATNLADVIARSAGLSFRAAHGIVGRVVRNAIAEGVAPADLTSAAVDRAANDVAGTSLDLGDDVVRAALDPVRFVESRVTTGSVRPDEVRRMLADGSERLRQERQWLEGARARVDAAHDELAKEVAAHRAQQ
jgi:argininosuccinate lyase